MKTIHVKMARMTIQSSEYRSKRMDKINREIAYWIACESASNTSIQRECCQKMQQMFLKRYQYYLKNRHGDRKSNGQDSPGV